MAIGEIKHKRRKLATRGFHPRRMAVNLLVQRKPLGMGEQSGSYIASACVGDGLKRLELDPLGHQMKNRRLSARCTVGYGSSPTKAAKKALTSLARKLK